MVLEINLWLIKKYEGKSTKQQTRASDSDQILKVVFHVPEKTTGVLFWVWMKVILLKRFLETTTAFCILVAFGDQNLITNLVLKRYFRLLIGRKNVKVCQIKKTTFAPPSETCFRHVSKQNKRFRSPNIHSKIVSKTFHQTVSEIKQDFQSFEKVFWKTFRRRLCWNSESNWKLARSNV